MAKAETHHLKKTLRLNVNKSAFTMLELVMVIVVLGILAALALPRMERDIHQEAADNILSAIRYTQHMALMDDVTKPNNPKWQQAFWRFGFQGCSDNGIFYYVGSDKDTEGNIDAGEEAMDPANGHPMMGLNTEPCENDLSEQKITIGGTDYPSSSNIFITKKYGISDSNITYAGGCSSAAQHIAFDYMGRPHTGITNLTKPDFSTLMHEDCNLTFGFVDSSIAPFTITIEKETGHAFIVGQPDS